jgi:hypothetical protein
MDLATIDVTPEEAEAKLAEYQAQLAADRTAEDTAIAQAYRAVRRGLAVIELSKAIHAGGYFPNNLPRIAVCRADATECWVERSGWGNAGPAPVCWTQWDPELNKFRRGCEGDTK